MQFVFRAGVGRHRRECCRRDGHAEERDRQRIDDLRVAERRHGPAREPRSDQRIDVGRELHHAAAGDDRQEIANNFSHMHIAPAEREPRAAAEKAQDQRKLYGELQPAAGDRAPRGPDRDAGLRVVPAEDQGGDDRGAPDNRGRVAEEKAVVAVEHADAERRQHQQRDAGKEDADQLDGERARLAGEAGRDQIEQPGRRSDADEREDGRDQRQQSGDGSGDLARLLLFAFRS